MKRRISGLLLMTLLLLFLSGIQAEPDLTLLDTTEKSGSWEEAYAGILTERADDIQAYQDYVLSITSMPSCFPVDLLDLTGDGIPELLFLDLTENAEYGFSVGRLWIYTSDDNGVHCALTLQPEIDDLLYSRYYLADDGLLTIHFLDCEMEWTLQLGLLPEGYYQTETILTEQPDFSGESPDQYFLNGTEISASRYRSLTEQIQSSQGRMIGSLMVDDGGCGFTYTPAEALDALASGNIQESSTAP